MKSQNRVGVYFRIQNDQEGQDIFEFLDQFKSSIREELNDNVMWNWDNLGDFGVRFPCDNVFDENNREEIKEFFKYWLNHFVNVMRPKLKKMDN